MQLADALFFFSFNSFTHVIRVFIINYSLRTQLRWYGTPCNIFKDERILKYDYGHGFKNSKPIAFAPKMRF